MSGASTVGLYGKLPCRGDFLQMRLPPEFVAAWDGWLQESLTASRRQLQERWLDAYLTSPVWRFALARGLCGEDAYAGVLLPSVDRVGRYFPLAVVARLEVAVSPFMTACSQESWFEYAQALAIDALDAPCLDLEDFDRRVATLASGMNGTPEYLPCPPDRTGVGDSTRRVSYRYLPHSGGRSLQSTLSAVALCELERALNPMSLWWTDGSNDIGPTALCVSGLPDPEAFAAMLCRQSPAPE